MGAREIIDTLIQGYQQKDPRLYDILRTLASQIEQSQQDVRSYLESLTAAQAGDLGILLAPTGFSYAFPGSGLRLSWDLISSASLYEIRQGSSWATANFVTRTASNQVVLPPVVAGVYTYLIKSIGFLGQYSTDSASLSVTVSSPSITAITGSVLDNNVLLYWTPPVTKAYDISRYNLYKNGALIGSKTGSFTTLFETVAGSFAYGIAAVDLAGNVGITNEITLTVNQPADYELLAEGSTFVWDMSVRCSPSLDYPGIQGLIGPHLSESWTQHFTNHSWNTIQDQIDAGYPRYLQPNDGYTAVIEKQIDFGTVIDSSIVAIDYDLVALVGSFTVLVEMCSSLSFSTGYSAYTIGSSQLFSNFRYVRFRITLTPSAQTDIFLVSNLRYRADVKQATDSGSVNAVATDVNGTPVTFNKAFKDINSITLTVDSVEPITAIFAFTDTPNPTGFSVFAFDSTGNRVSYPVDWKARGLI